MPRGKVRPGKAIVRLYSFDSSPVQGEIQHDGHAEHTIVMVDGNAAVITLDNVSDRGKAQAGAGFLRGEILALLILAHNALIGVVDGEKNRCRIRLCFDEDLPVFIETPPKVTTIQYPVFIEREREP